MRKIIRHITSFILLVFLSGQTLAQESETTDFFTQIKNYNLSEILSADSFFAGESENANDRIKRAEILGFIGSDYQRFFIHFVSIIQNPIRPYEYLVYGKTKVKETICSFQGTIIIRQARTFDITDSPEFKQGFATCDVILYEDNKQSSTGFIKGVLKSYFIIDPKGQFRYDALMIGADGFSNNQFMGSWTSYKTNASKKCNWGDYRIPESEELDSGAGDFYVDDKYLKNGWENYMLANSYDANEMESHKAKQKENEIWWK